MEGWREIPGHSAYDVSSEGRIRTWKPINRNASCLTAGRILTGSICLFGGKNNGKIPYWRVTIDGCPMRIHVLVLTAFRGPRPKGCVSRHLDGNSLSNKLENLVWGTQAENMIDKQRGPNAQIGERHPQAKLTETIVRKLRLAQQKYGVVKRQRQIAKKLGVRQSTINNMLKGRTWKHVS